MRCYVRIRPLPSPQQKTKDCISYHDDTSSSNSSSSGSARVGTTIKLRNTNSYNSDESKAFTFDKVRKEYQRNAMVGVVDSAQSKHSFSVFGARTAISSALCSARGNSTNNERAQPAPDGFYLSACLLCAASSQ